MSRAAATKPPQPDWDASRRAPIHSPGPRPHRVNPLEHRSAVIADLVRSFEAYFAEHRVCDGLAGSIVEVTENGVLWGVAWVECSACSVHWERRLAV